MKIFLDVDKSDPLIMQVGEVFLQGAIILMMLFAVIGFIGILIETGKQLF